jgi:hypothetical protein
MFLRGNSGEESVLACDVVLGRGWGYVRGVWALCT